jgi:hypothetical protein
MHSRSDDLSSGPASDWEVTTVETINISRFAMPWLASLRSENVAVPASGAQKITVLITTPATLGLAACGAAKLRQEKTALVQARLGAAAFAYGTTGMVTDHAADFGRPVGDPQTTRTANGGVQGPPPWRQPVIT